jgi:hypothetical protein
MILKIALVVLIIWISLKVINFLAKRIFLIFVILFVLYGITQAQPSVNSFSQNIEINK